MRYIISVVAIVIFAACGQRVPVYEINGTWEGGDGKTVYLKKSLGNRNYAVFDSVVVKGGKFQMKDKLKQLEELSLDCGTGPQPLILDDTPITVKCEMVTKEYKGKEVQQLNVSIEGSIEQRIYRTFLGAQRDEMLIMMGVAFMDKEDSVKVDSMAQFYLKVKKRSEEIQDSLVKTYTDSYAAALILKNMAKQRGVAEVEQLYTAMSDRIKATEVGVEIQKELEKMKSVEEGSMAPDFTLTSPAGESIKLSDLRGKYVLLDFWASWCGPCLREVPNVKKVYEKYHDQGFEIFSVSLDEDKAKWEKAITDNGLNWVHGSSLQGWNCPVAKLYNVRGVPAMLLIDKEGQIIATSLRGEALMEKVAEQFNK